MNFKIDIAKPEGDFWEKLNLMGIHRYTKLEGLVYKYVTVETAIRIIEGNCLQYSLPSSFNDPFDLTSDLLDTSASREDIIKLVTDSFVASEDEIKRIIDFILQNPHTLPDIFFKTLNEAKSNIGITCFSKSPFKALMWSHYANKHAGVCLGFAFEKSAGDGLIQLGVRYASEITALNYFKETVYSIYN